MILKNRTRQWWHWCAAVIGEAFENLKKKPQIYRSIDEREEGREKKKLWNLERKSKKISKWTGLFSVNGLGYNFCGIFEEKKIIVRISGKTEGKKAVNLV